jgi:chaperone modulatory protein CbpM
MTANEHYELQILDSHTEIAFAELVRAFDSQRDELIELMRCGVLEPRGSVDSDEASWRFSAEALSVARRAARLRDGFELDAPALALTLGLLERIEELQRRVRELECRLPR